MDAEKQLPGPGLAAAAPVDDHDHDHDKGLVSNLAEQSAIPEQPYGIWSLLAMGYSVSNTAMSLTASLITGIGSGGPVVFTWGQIMIFIFSLCVACSLAEMASAFPHPGGQYYWASRLAPQSIRRGVSYLVGLLSWAGVVLTCASGTLAIPSMVIGMLILRNPDFSFHPWQLFVGYQITNIFIASFNFVEFLLPKASLFNMWWSVTSIVIIFITVLAASPTKQSGSFVFTDYINVSGWSDGIAFLTGMLGANWGFTNLDAVTHMAEEIPNPRVNIPRALMATVITGIGVSFPYAVGLMFSIQSVDDILTTPTGVPSLALFRQVLGNDAGAIGLQCLILIAFVGAIQGVHTWQARVAWAFARDHGWPFSSKLAEIAPAPFQTPIYAHLWSCGAVALLGCLYLGSTVAFNSFIGAGILFQYLSYSVCIILLLLRGRSSIPHGPFWYPRLGYIANLVTLAWTTVTLIFYCFPTAYPTTASTMNYASCVVAFIFLYAGFYWALWGRKTFTLPREKL
ncbi:hypothetical protein A1O3_06069 [Capronia epimyces CBS 606.96]|uniref:Choline transport protein n=1 Tax=Capronia epimyces CBS 606.96 TaxID=1182542 RepID=W9XZ55_9EURO|nr:uncharacterized protein A1O3_06069 [Capronia epimyces CBS 606.96]EXJ82256.1 hypothetical protein A1O3_06069 [Capronia epimyces CBS 606.96]